MAPEPWLTLAPLPGIAYISNVQGVLDMTSDGLRKLAFALLMALILYVTITAAGA